MLPKVHAQVGVFEHIAGVHAHALMCALQNLYACYQMCGVLGTLHPLFFYAQVRKFGLQILSALLCKEAHLSVWPCVHWQQGVGYVYVHATMKSTLHPPCNVAVKAYARRRQWGKALVRHDTAKNAMWE